MLWRIRFDHSCDALMVDDKNMDEAEWVGSECWNCSPFEGGNGESVCFVDELLRVESSLLLRRRTRGNDMDDIARAWCVVGDPGRSLRRFLAEVSWWAFFSLRRANSGGNEFMRTESR